MKVLRFIFGVSLTVIVCIPYILLVMLYIFGKCIYGSIKYKESFKELWSELYGAFIQGIQMGMNEIKTTNN